MANITRLTHNLFTGGDLPPFAPEQLRDWWHRATSAPDTIRGADRCRLAAWREANRHRRRPDYAQDPPGRGSRGDSPGSAGWSSPILCLEGEVQVFVVWAAIGIQHRPRSSGRLGALTPTTESSSNVKAKH